MRALGPLAATAACLALLAAPAAAPAAKPWERAETVSRVPGAPAAAIDAQGFTVLAWAGGSAGRRGAYGARRTQSRGFGEPFGLRTQRNWVDSAAVAFSASGDAIVAYRRFLAGNHRIESRTVRRSGSRTPPVSLSGPGSSAYDPAFTAVAAGGLAPDPVLAWWRREADRVQLARAVNGRLFTSSNDTVAGAQRAQYAQLAGGTVLAASATPTAVLIAARPPGGDFGEPVTIASGSGPFRDAQLAVGPQDEVAVAWREYDGDTYRLRVAVAPPDGAFGPAETLSSADERAVAPQVAITTDGAVRVAYRSTAPGNDSGPRPGRLKLATTGGQSPAAVVTGGRQRALAYELRAGGRGEVTLAWQRAEPGNLGSGAVFARAVTPSGRVGVRQLLTAPGEDGFSPTLAVGPRGDAVVAWVVGQERLRAAYRPPSG